MLLYIIPIKAVKILIFKQTYTFLRINTSSLVNEWYSASGYDLKNVLPFKNQKLTKIIVEKTI